jgi:ribosomal protein S18 acetylase RimI-like enzyme
MVLLMHVILRKARKKDMPLIEKFTIETGWKGIPESQRTLLDREKWNRHMVEVFEDFYKRENSRIFVAEDEGQAFVGYVFVGESNDMLTGLWNFGFIYEIFVEEKSGGKGIGKMLLERAESYCREKTFPGLR